MRTKGAHLPRADAEGGVLPAGQLVVVGGPPAQPHIRLGGPRATKAPFLNLLTEVHPNPPTFRCSTETSSKIQSIQLNSMEYG